MQVRLPPLFGRFEVRGSAERTGGRDRSCVDQGQKNIETTQSESGMISCVVQVVKVVKGEEFVEEHCEPKKSQVQVSRDRLSGTLVRAETIK